MLGSRVSMVRVSLVSERRVESTARVRRRGRWAIAAGRRAAMVVRSLREAPRQTRDKRLLSGMVAASLAWWRLPMGSSDGRQRRMWTAAHVARAVGESSAGDAHGSCVGEVQMGGCSWGGASALRLCSVPAHVPPIGAIPCAVLLVCVLLWRGLVSLERRTA